MNGLSHGILVWTKTRTPGHLDHEYNMPSAGRLCLHEACHDKMAAHLY